MGKNEEKIPLSDTQKAKHLEDIYYEFWMFFWTANQLLQDQFEIKKLEPVQEHNAILESFLLHLRVIAEFFNDPERIQHDSLNAKKFFNYDADDSKNKVKHVFQKIHREDENGNKFYTLLHKHLAHPSEKRIEKKSWNFPNIFKLIKELFNSFSEHIKDKSFFRKSHYFEDIKKLIQENDNLVLYRFVSTDKLYEEYKGIHLHDECDCRRPYWGGTTLNGREEIQEPETLFSVNGEEYLDHPGISNGHDGFYADETRSFSRLDQPDDIPKE